MSVYLRCFLLLLLTAAAGVATEDSRGMGTRATGDSPHAPQYAGSYALLVGVSEYDDPAWGDLESIPSELKQVRVALESCGFKVRQVNDPKGDALEAAFEDFIDDYGYDSGNRLFFFYAGHGWSNATHDRGYLVPRDAPAPNKDMREFNRRALNMSKVQYWCRDMTAHHALFAFDSCFAGTIFKTRSLDSRTPPYISAVTKKPVRHFITSGSAGEEVPAKSVFVPSMIRAMRGEGDLNGDGYLTGTELGMFLKERVLDYRTGQTPQDGKIRDPDLDEGEFVIRLASYGPLSTKSAKVVGVATKLQEADGLNVKTLDGGNVRHDAEALMGQAVSSMEAKDYSSAINYYLEIVKQGSVDAEVFVELTRACVLDGRLELAERVALELVQMEPDVAEYMRRYLVLAPHSHDRAELSEIYQNASNRFSDSPIIALSVARGYHHLLKDETLALEAYRKYLRIASSDNPLRKEAEGAIEMLEATFSGRNANFDYVIPAGWSDVSGSGFRKAEFVISSDIGTVRVSALAFPGDVGGVLVNINRWRRQVGLDPIDESMMTEVCHKRLISGVSARYIRILGDKEGILGAILTVEGKTWFFKMSGDSGAVLAEESKMKMFLDSVRLKPTEG